MLLGQEGFGWSSRLSDDVLGVQNEESLAADSSSSKERRTTQDSGDVDF